MPKKYIIRPGDTLSSIAKKHQLASWEALYQSPDNDSLRKKRPNPNQVIPGDIIYLPDSANDPVDILAAIDGTGSSDWIGKNKDGTILGDNSHVYRFWQDFQTAHPAGKGAFKRYFAGPNTLGTNVDEIVKQVLQFVREKLELVPQARVSMVGHSRGGLIAILASTALKSPVHFLGLYDAVDRHKGPSARKIPGNVKTVYHAVRSPATRSRMGFGNCGREYEPGVSYHEASFNATHGGIGGDSQGAQETEAKHTKILTGAALLIGGPLAAAITYHTIDVRVDLEDDRKQGKAADRFIRDGATTAGLRIAG